MSLLSPTNAVTITERYLNPITKLNRILQFSIARWH